jgi:hypothetical protein
VTGTAPGATASLLAIDFATAVRGGEWTRWTFSIAIMQKFRYASSTKGLNNIIEYDLFSLFPHDP